MSSLPLELLQYIAGYASTNDLYAFRAASKTFCAVATPRVFRALRCTSTSRSTEGIVGILGSVYLHAYVEEFVYADWYVTWGNGSPSLTPPQEQEAQVQGNLSQAIPLLRSLPALHTISLSFSLYFEEETSAYIEEPSPGLQLQYAIFNALAALPRIPTLRTLILDNITPFPNEVFTDAGFLAFLQGLTHLRISTASDTQLEGAVFQDPIVKFYTETLPPLLRAPIDTLTSLSLHSDQDVGSAPGLSFADIHYPHLTHLSLQSVLFEDGTGAEAFILAHAATLTALTLTFCRIAFSEDDDEPDRTWADVYRALSEGLVNLRQLEVKESWEGMDYPDANPNGRKLRYVKMDSGWGWNGHFDHGEDTWSGGDALALEEFREVIRAKTNESE
ncbi:hypothetical protein BV25DRAFT_1913164 [Artomyces pyxidatus]|uniref:Uncharacterized protein n=1 Tax=Artomyces pyxidatus TaxID=48021 RepID=A0ACB8TBM9_9AGAM|nr:hypothetical protein BV25DRAFT_1913164 [Artomyces pyxidatus]